MDGQGRQETKLPLLPLLMTRVLVMLQNWLFIALSLSCILPVSVFPEVASRVLTYLKANKRRDDIMTFPCSKHCSLAGG